MEGKGDILLRTEHLTKIYGTRRHRVWAVDDVSLVIKQGESLALIGESGSGKTTFGKLISGLERVSSGDIWFQSQKVDHLSDKEFRPYRKNLQMIFQSSTGVFDPTYTIGDSIREVLNNFGRHSREETERAVDAALEQVGLDPQLKDRFVFQLSGGQCQRANIARALVLQPSLVICDEPVSSLDYSLRRQVLELLRDIQEKSQVTYLLITHDLSNVPYLCRTVAIMYQGQVVEYLKVAKDLEDRILHPYTKLLFHSVPKPDPDRRNILEGEDEAENLPQFREGCLFSARCPHCSDICRMRAPAEKEISSGHMIRCHLYE